MLLSPSIDIQENSDKMVRSGDQSTDTEHADENVVRRHNRSSSSDQAKPQINSSGHTIQYVEPHSTPVSPGKSKSTRPEGKRRKTSSSTSTKHKSSRPAYSRKYSTPPSRPLSPAGFPALLEPDMVIPELSLNQANHSLLATPIYSNYSPVVNNHAYHDLTVDTAPQEPDIWSDPETDYFSTFEGAGPKHSRAKSRRQINQSANASSSLNAILSGSANTSGLQQISEDAEGEFLTPDMPGRFA